MDFTYVKENYFNLSKNNSRLILFTTDGKNGIVSISAGDCCLLVECQ